jgi:hypothetical protein
MREYFEKQFQNNQKVTKEKLAQVEQKTYTSGKEIEVGDTVLFAVLEKENGKEMVALHESELENYQYSGISTEFLPHIKEK